MANERWRAFAFGDSVYSAIPGIPAAPSVPCFQEVALKCTHFSA